MKETSANKQIEHSNRYSCLGIFNFVICGLIGFVLLVSLFFSQQSSLFNFFGSKFIIVLIFIAILCAFSPLYLKLIKKKRIKTIFMCVITAVFAIFILTSYLVSENYFKDFTTEKWLEYPQARSKMLDDLISNHNIIGMDEDGVIELLGIPDAKNESVYSYYIRHELKDQMYIHVKFENKKVVSVTYHFVT